MYGGSVLVMNHTTRASAGDSPGDDWAWPKVKERIESSGTTLSAVARAIGRTPAAAWQVKRKPIPTLQSAIAAAVGVPPQIIWPSRYDHRGHPVKRNQWLATQAQKERRA